MKKVSIGTHILLNLLECNQDLLTRSNVVREILISTVEQSGLTKVAESFYQFEPSGVTGVLLLSESHICIHTWPEFNMAALDIFSCSDESKAQKATEILIEKFSAKRVEKQVCYR
ncbi:MAG: adenosylmethionine decarboxylase [Cyanobacteriota bacterium]